MVLNDHTDEQLRGRLRELEREMRRVDFAARDRTLTADEEAEMRRAEFETSAILESLAEREADRLWRERVGLPLLP